ncbi:MAG TPA: hypothetical protein VIW72_04710 [Burkholderiales bacterium]
MQDSSLKTSPSIIIVAVSAIILSLVGIVAITDEIRVVNAASSESEARGEEPDIKPNITSYILEKLASAQKAELGARHCANCGVVDSITIFAIKQNFNKLVTHQVKVRMDNGTYRVVSQQVQPVFHVGEKVKIVNGVVVQLEKATVTDKNGMFALMLAALSSRLF